MQMGDGSSARAEEADEVGLDGLNQAEHISSAAGREKYIQATFLGWSVQALAGFIPRWLLDCASAGKRTPRVRLCGRSAHEVSVRTAKMRAQIILPTSSPLATLDA